MKTLTINDNNYFKKIYKSGSSYVGAYIVLYAIKKRDESLKSSFGFTVTKKVGKAVVRNRVRRVIKEVVRLNYNQVDQRYDYVIVARVRCSNSSYDDINKNFHYLFNLLRKDKK